MSFSNQVANHTQAKINDLLLNAISQHAGFNVDVRWCGENTSRLSRLSYPGCDHCMLDGKVILIIYKDAEFTQCDSNGKYTVNSHLNYEAIKPS